MTDPRSRDQSPIVSAAVRKDPGPPLAPSAEEVYRDFFAYVWHTLRRLGTPASELEDAAHDVFVVVFRRLDDFDPQRPMKPWLFGISYRVVSERRRHRRRHPEVAAEPLEVVDDGPRADEEVARERDRALIAAALERLSLDERAVFVLHDVDGCTAPEIAGALEVPLNTVYSRLRRARRKFETAVRALRRRGGRP